MKNLVLVALAIFIFLAGQTDVRPQMSAIQKPKARPKVDLPEVPRGSAYEAYVKFKAGKAIILHAGGEKYERRHIMGAMDVIDPNDPNAGTNYKVRIPKLPKKGIEIFTYCY